MIYVLVDLDQRVSVLYIRRKLYCNSRYYRGQQEGSQYSRADDTEGWRWGVVGDLEYILLS